MSFAIGCLGQGTDHVAAYRAAKVAKREKVVRLAVPRRNQDRVMRLVAIPRPNGRILVQPVRAGHIGDVRMAYYYSPSKPKYLKIP